MKKLMSIMLILCYALAMLPCFAFGAGDAIDMNVLPMTGKAADKTADDKNYADFRGRLTISDAGIDVALYGGYAQSTCDRWDSACCFGVKGYSGKIIADHSNQEFSTLTSVKTGTTAVITEADGNVISLKCAEVIDGHNTGTTLTDGKWNNVMGKYDYLTYTCMDGWKNVRICQWEIVE